MCFNHGENISFFLRCEFSPQAAILEPAQPGPEVPRAWAIRRAERPPRF